MRLVLVFPPNFKVANEVANRIARYFPRLIGCKQLIEDERLMSSFHAEQIVEVAEKAAKPDWKTDIVFVAISGPVHFCEFILGNYAETLEGFTLGSERKLPSIPKLGGYFNMPALRRAGLENASAFLSKVAVEEILHVFTVPKNHDPSCFYHPKEWPTREDSANEFCAKCLLLTASLEDPINIAQTHALVDKLYKG